MVEQEICRKQLALEQRLAKVQAQQNGDISKAKERMQTLIRKPNILAMLKRLAQQ